MCFVRIMCAGGHLVVGLVHVTVLTVGNCHHLPPGLDLTIGRLKQILLPEEVGGGSMALARTKHKVTFIMGHGRFMTHGQAKMIVF